ncbi:MAG: sugar phosphate isomerase/epimerase family protein [Thermoguttaceae bacterium]|jgi:sugar phosphate isomerase/epimerase
MKNNIKYVLQPIGRDRKEIYELAMENNYGIEIVDFALPKTINDSKLYDDLIKQNKNELINIGELSFHGPFIDIILHSMDNDIKRISREKIEKAISTSLELNCKTIIFHSGINSLITNNNYIGNTVDIHAEYWDKLLEKYNEITIYLENMWEKSADVLIRITQKVKSNRLKICLDTGHANVFGKEPIDKWLNVNIDYIHFNDNNGDEDSEYAVGDGNINWEKIFKKILLMNNGKIRTVLEVGTIERIKKSIEYIEKYSA